MRAAQEVADEEPGGGLLPRGVDVVNLGRRRHLETVERLRQRLAELGGLAHAGIGPLALHHLRSVQLGRDVAPHILGLSLGNAPQSYRALLLSSFAVVLGRTAEVGQTPGAHYPLATKNTPTIMIPIPIQRFRGIFSWRTTKARIGVTT